MLIQATTFIVARMQFLYLNFSLFGYSENNFLHTIWITW